LEVNITPPLPYFAPKSCHFWPNYYYIHLTLFSSTTWGKPSPER